MTSSEVPPAVESSGYLWTFGNAVLDERQLELKVAGDVVEIERKTLEVLMFLLRHSGEVVTKDELLESVWPGRVLTDSAVAKSISRAREALGDRDQTVIKTIRGFGYKFVAEVSVDRSKVAGPSKLNLCEGDRPPLRPLWSLSEKLGAGGQGEVWLVRHDKTRELRVFKFSIDVTGLSSLKREITISRYLKDSLGGQDCFLSIVDWNLEEAPYFLESAYVASGNLEQWARSLGGVDKLPLPVRIEIVARAADALARAHSVGVLHKDLKPSNMLVDVTHGEDVPCVKLADFGSGGFLNLQRLEDMGISRIGFTRTMANDPSGVTALYLAPEIVGGQPFTVQADIYALGVVLFQIVVGDFARPPAPGWEARIDDPLLREDIALAMAGDPAQRLQDATSLAKRLRALEQRRAQAQQDDDERKRRQHERKIAEQHARKAELDSVRWRSRRLGLAAAFSALTVGLVISIWQYADAEKARVQALKAAETNKAVATFLSDDLFAQVTDRPLRDLTVQELLNAASTSLDSRFSDLPAVAAQLHAALGRAYWKMELVEPAKTHFDLAMKGYAQSGLLGSGDAINVAADLMLYLAGSNDYSGSEALYREIRQTIADRKDGLTQEVNKLEFNHAWVQVMAGRWLQAVDSYQRLIERMRLSKNPDVLAIARADTRLGHVQARLGRFDQAEKTLRSASARLIEISGPSSTEVAEVKVFLGKALIESGALSQARIELFQALEIFRNWTSIESSALQSSTEAALALIKLRQGEPIEAIEDLQRILKGVDAWNYSAEFHAWLAEAYDQAGRLELAEQAAHNALDLAEAADGPQHPLSILVRIRLADIVRRSQGAGHADSLIQSIDPSVVNSLGVNSPQLVALRRLQGMIARDRANHSDSVRLLTQANSLSELLYGPNHATTLEIKGYLRAAQLVAHD